MSVNTCVRMALVICGLLGGQLLADETSPSSEAPKPEVAAEQKSNPMPLAGEPIKPPAPSSDSPIAAITQPPQLPPGSVSSPWSGPGGTGCCGPVGKHGPIMNEIFLRTGVNVLTSGGLIKETLQTGYTQSIGGRSLFFNPVGSAAWTAELGIDYFFNNGSKSDFEYPIDVVSPPNQPNIQNTIFASIREYNRAALHVALGREYYMFTPAYQSGKNFRLGGDIGFRYGYSRLNLNTISEDGSVVDFDRRSDVYKGFFLSLHTDYEVPLNCCWTFVTGFRTEYGFNYSNIARLQNCDWTEVNFLLNFGVRF